MLGIKQYFSYKCHLACECSGETPQDAPAFFTRINVESKTIYLSSIFNKNTALT